MQHPQDVLDMKVEQGPDSYPKFRRQPPTAEALEEYKQVHQLHGPIHIGSHVADLASWAYIRAVVLRASNIADGRQCGSQSCWKLHPDWGTEAEGLCL